MADLRVSLLAPDVLLIDDLHKLANRTRSQEELFAVMDSFLKRGRQLVFTARCAPDDLPSFEARLISRMKSGLVASLEQPCLETQLVIVRGRARAWGLEVPELAVPVIAEKLQGNLGALDFLLGRIAAMNKPSEGALSLALVRQALEAGGDERVRVT